MFMAHRAAPSPTKWKLFRSWTLYPESSRNPCRMDLAYKNVEGQEMNHPGKTPRSKGIMEPASWLIAHASPLDTLPIPNHPSHSSSLTSWWCLFYWVCPLIYKVHEVLVSFNIKDTGTLGLVCWLIPLIIHDFQIVWSFKFFCIRIQTFSSMFSQFSNKTS